MAKELLSLQWMEDLLPEGHRRKAMFGGFGYYVDELMILALFEGSKEWNGCLFPVERENHARVMEIFPLLKPHSILGKWLYLSSDTENFEAEAEAVIQRMCKEVSKQSGLFGVIPERKKVKAPAKTKKDVLEGIDYRRINTKRPRMFGDEPADEALKKAKKISDLKNLGPTTDAHFKKAGIKTVDAFIKMGWQKAFAKLAKSNPKSRHAIYAYALIGAIQNKNAFQISEQDKLAARELSAALKPKKIQAKKTKPKSKLKSKPKR